MSKENNIKKILHKYDIPEKVLLNLKSKQISIDTESTGLQTSRDRLCLVQILLDNEVHLIHFPTPNYASPNLKKLLKKKDIEKLFHFARFDVGIIQRYLNISLSNVICTRVLSKIARTYSDKHGLKELCRELLKKDLNKGEQSSYWGNDSLTDSQISYAANDVIFLPEIYSILKDIAQKENRYEVAEKVFKMIPDICFIDNNKFNPVELIEHHTK